jgi:hypothetical protein
MALTDIIKDELGRAKFTFLTPSTKQGLLEYARDGLRGLIEELPAYRRKEADELIDKIFSEKFEKYREHLHSWYGRAADIAGISATLTSTYLLTKAMTFPSSALYAPLQALFVGAKAIPETMYMARYVRDSGDFYGIAKWLGMKAVELAVPVIGPLMGVGWVEKIIRQRIVYETKRDVLKELGLYGEPIHALDKAAENATGYKIRPAYGAPYLMGNP